MNCHKDISAGAKVCPYCHRDTTESSAVHGALMGGAIIGGGIGYLVNDLFGMFVGIIAGGLICGIGPMIKASLKPGPAAKVTITPLDVTPPTIQPPSVPRGASGARQMPLAERLANLEEAKTKGFINEAEYSRKKAQILDEA